MLFKSLKFRLIILLAIIVYKGSTCQLAAQDKPILLDSTTFDPKNADLIETKSTRVPSKASFYSAVLPGLGQAYNRKYWKIPLIYGAFAATGAAVVLWNDNLQVWRQRLFDTLNGMPNPLYSQSFITANIDRSRQKRDFFIILIGVTYLLNVLEAHIDAHLQEFEVNDNLSLSISPYLENEVSYFNSTGVSFKINFR